MTIWGAAFKTSMAYYSSVGCGVRIGANRSSWLILVGASFSTSRWSFNCTCQAEPMASQAKSWIAMAAPERS